MDDSYPAHEGYLLLADISGYTAFLTSSELSHAQAIIHELTGLVRSCLVPPMRFVKVEGDAVFCYADGNVFADGERLVELIEVCYFDFSNRLLNMTRSTTCPCTACSMIGTLDLKFLVHYGTFVTERDGGSQDLAGADVIVVHRLLKNAIVGEDGPSAYAFFTDAVRRRMACLADLPVHVEHDRVLGDISGGVHDLKRVYAALRERRRVYVGADDADFEISVDVPVPPSVAWKYWVEPLERQRWACRHFSKHPDRLTRNGKGRVGQGAAMHCNHGPGTWTAEFIDWRPFDYFTTLTTAPRVGRFFGPRPQQDTVEFVPTDDGGTRIVHRVRLTNRGRVALMSYGAQRLLQAAFWRRANNLLAEVVRGDGPSADLTPSRPAESGLDD